MTIKESIQFEQNLYNLINSCGLPVDTAFYILKSVYLDFQKTLYECADKQPNDAISEEKINYDLDIKPISTELQNAEVVPSSKKES